YGLVLEMAGIGYFLLVRMLIACNGASSTLARAVGRDLKGKLSLAIYAAATLLAFVQPWIAIALYIIVAVIWFVPDRRIESII
ncbi:MAG: TMEM175 family protein, partial [Methylocella sp.]